MGVAGFHNAGPEQNQKWNKQILMMVITYYDNFKKAIIK